MNPYRARTPSPEPGAVRPRDSLKVGTTEASGVQRPSPVVWYSSLFFFLLLQERSTLCKQSCEFWRMNKRS